MNGPPDPPEVSITSQTMDTVTVKLRPRDPEDRTPVHGYTLHYKPEFGDWNEAQIPFGSEEYTARQPALRTAIPPLRHRLQLVREP